MRPRDRELANRLTAGLESFEQERPLPGIADAASREVLIEQLLSSVHRVEYVRRLTEMDLSSCRTNPEDIRFDPLKAAVLHARSGNADEAFWLTFLSVHFGKHGQGGWRCLREIYGRLGSDEHWNWHNVSTNLQGFRTWLSDHENELRREGAPGCFGNHRKYESLNGHSPVGTGAVVESYVLWVAKAGGHGKLVQGALAEVGSDPRRAFDSLYRSMERYVIRFGRLARFDYLAMLGKLALAPIEPGSTYLDGATGPLKGARLLFGGNQRPVVLDSWLAELDAELQVGMQVLEDALCNWQKSPDAYLAFRG